MSWTNAVLAAVQREAAKADDFSFTRAALLENQLDQIVADVGSLGKTPEQTMSRELQQLRDAGLIRFVDDSGTYQWIGNNHD